MKRTRSKFSATTHKQLGIVFAWLMVCFSFLCAAVILWAQENRAASVAGLLFLVACCGLLLALRQLQQRFIEPVGQVLQELGSMTILKKNVGTELPADTPIMPVVAQVNRGLENLNRLVGLIENINRDTSFEGILQYIYDTFSVFIPYSHIGVALLQEDGKTLEASYGIAGDKLANLPRRLLGITAVLNETTLSDIVQNGTPRVINDLEQYTKNPDSPYNRILLQEGVRSSISLPLQVSGQPVGIIFFSNHIKNIYRKEHIEFLKVLANSIAISLNKNIFIDRLLYGSVLALAKLAESRDEETGDHLDRMKQYAKWIAQMLLEDGCFPGQMTLSLAREIERFSPMHDIGKVGVRDGILRKPGKLTAEEFAEMQTHPLHGAEVLRAAQSGVMLQNPRLFAVGIEIAEAHHERWDGSGYPYGLQGEEIPLSARVVTVADVFDALTSKRVYKDALSFDTSFAMLLEARGTHFDPQIIDCVVRHKEEFYRLFLQLTQAQEEDRPTA